MLLITSGCSYTYGEELENKSDSWPYKLKDLLNFDSIINRGLCSGSNDYIIRSIIEEIQKIKDFSEIFVVAGFTTDNRREAFSSYLDSFVFLKNGRRFVEINKNEIGIIKYKDQKSKFKSTLAEISDYYMTEFESDLIYCIIKKIDQILLLDGFLNSLNIKHLFFNSISNLHIPNDYKIKINDKKIIRYIEKIVFFNKTINSRCYINSVTMDEFCKIYPLGDLEKHPLEEGHKKWAEFLFDHIKENDLL